jgi:hypothetical protein
MNYHRMRHERQTLEAQGQQNCNPFLITVIQVLEVMYESRWHVNVAGLPPSPPQVTCVGV